VTEVAGDREGGKGDAAMSIMRERFNYEIYF